MLAVFLWVEEVLRLTGDGGDGLEVGGRTILQVDGDWARGISPGEGKWLPSGNTVECGVGEGNSLGDREGSSSEEDVGELHFG